LAQTSGSEKESWRGGKEERRPARSRAGAAEGGEGEKRKARNNGMKTILRDDTENQRERGMERGVPAKPARKGRKQRVGKHEDLPEYQSDILVI
jgi:hypothetical protein